MNKSKSDNALLSSGDVLNMLKVLRRNLVVVLVFPLIFGVIGFYYTYNMTEYYGAQTQILIKNDETYNYQERIYQSIGYYQAYQNMANQKRVITSREILSRTIQRLNFNVNFFVRGRLKTEEETHYIPFKLDFFEIKNKSWYGNEIDVVIDDKNSIEIGVGEKDNKEFYSVTFYDTMSFGGNRFVFVPTKEFVENWYNMKSIDYFFKIYSDKQLVSKYKGFLSVENEENTSILNIKVQDELPERAVQFLDTLTSVYIDYSLESKFKVNENTLKFIDKQLDEIIEILSGIEDTMDRFKSNNAILDLPKESEEYFLKMIEMDDQKRNWRLMLQDLDALEGYIDSLNTKNEKVLPSSYYIGEKDQFLQQALKQLYDLQIQKNATKSSTTEKNYRYKRLVDEINLLKEDVLVYIQNSKAAIIERIRGFSKEAQEYRNIISKVPAKERGLLKISRRLQVNEKMYLYLLEKKANTIIARAGIVSETKVIEKARSTGLTSPNKTRFILIFIVIGFVLSGISVYLRELFFRKINSIEELSRLTNLPIIGHVFYVKNYSGVDQILKHPKGRLAESFRSIRAKIAFMNSSDSGKSHKILISSIGPGEGKTYSSINLAITLARANKKVVLVELDMHKPRIYRAFGISGNNEGMSTFLTGKSEFEKCIHSSGIDCLDLVLCGPLPPNPSDLIQLNKMDELFDNLNQLYDYVIIDTPPIGLISDALSLQKFSDSNIFVLNTKFSRKKEVNYINDMVEENDLKNVGLILNGVRVNKWRYYYSKYSYGYSYGYGYGYGYGYIDKN